MTKYTIIHRDFENKKVITHSVREGKSKKEMAELYRMNGVAVLAVVLDREIDSIATQSVYDIELEIIMNPAKQYKYYVKQVILEQC